MVASEGFESWHGKFTDSTYLLELSQGTLLGLLGSTEEKTVPVVDSLVIEAILEKGGISMLYSGVD
jgi:hypothetical protein